jgi:hypothetical protein
MDISNAVSGIKNALGIGSDIDPRPTIGDRFPELKLSMKDDDLLSLTKKWKSSSDNITSKYSDTWKENIAYWKGKQDDGASSDEAKKMENRIFSGFETFLPILTRQKPDPIVSLADKKERQMIDTQEEQTDDIDVSELLQSKLQDLNDTEKIKLKMKTSGRYWGLYQIAVAETKWDVEEDRPRVDILKATQCLFDSEGTIEEGRYTGKFLGKYVTDTANDMIKKFPAKEKFIKEQIETDLDTKITYIEWWTDEFKFWEWPGKEILDKMKNPHWNEDEDVQTFDEVGNPIEEVEEGFNHFKSRRMPFAFLSVYNIGNSVIDDTGIIQQSIPNQDTVNKRIRQIDKNTDNQNNSVAFFGLDEQQAAKALRQLRKGGAVTFTDKTQQGFERVGGTPLTGDVYSDKTQNAQAIDSNFATNAVTRGEQTNDQTVRGKIITRASDESRIGFISEYLEQYIDVIYNQITQLYYVYDDDFKEVIRTQNPGQLIVSVKEGSMIPKDPLTQRNEAIDLYTAGAMDILTLYERLEVENPKEVAKRTVLQQLDPQTYLTEVLDFSPQQAQTPQEGMEVPVEGEVPLETQPEAPQAMPEDVLGTIPLEQIDQT